MSIGASNLVLFGSATMPEDDVTINIGGAIDTTKKVVFTDIAVTGRVEALSDTGGDTETLDISYRTAAGVFATELQTLTGATVVAFTASMERIIKIEASDSAHGQFTVRKLTAGTNLATLPNGVSQVRRIFFKAVAPTSGTKSYYDKIYAKNTHGTLALTEASIVENADPTGLVSFALDGTNAASNLILNINSGAATRTAPPSAGVTAFDSTTKGVRNSGNLTQGSAQGIWVRLLLASTDAATNTSYTIQVKGNST